MTPQTIERKCGGWLAVSPAGSALRIAVEATTEAEAVRRFSSAETAWMALLRSAAERGDGVETNAG
jgi:hypothetical protein